MEVEDDSSTSSYSLLVKLSKGKEVCMSIVNKPKVSNSVAESQVSKIIRMALLLVFNVGAIWFIYQASTKGFYHQIF